MPAPEPHLGPIDRGELPLQILDPPRVELVLIEALRVHLAGFDPLVALLGTLALDRGELLLDLLSLTGKQFSGALRLHADTVARAPPAQSQSDDGLVSSGAVSPRSNN